MKTGTPTVCPNGGHTEGCSDELQVLQAKAPVASTPATSLNRGRVPLWLMATIASPLSAVCPACGLTDTSASTSGPTLCSNCGHRDPAAWAERDN